MISIVVICEQLEKTKKCVESIEKTTKKPVEVIFIDNSDCDYKMFEFLEEKVYEYLNKDTLFEDSFVIKNQRKENKAVNWNQGIESGKYKKVLLCPEVIFPKNWQEEMLKFDQSLVVPKCYNLVENTISVDVFMVNKEKVEKYFDKASNIPFMDFVIRTGNSAIVDSLVFYYD